MAFYRFIIGAFTINILISVILFKKFILYTIKNAEFPELPETWLFYFGVCLGAIVLQLFFSFSLAYIALRSKRISGVFSLALSTCINAVAYAFFSYLALYKFYPSVISQYKKADIYIFLIVFAYFWTCYFTGWIAEFCFKHKKNVKLIYHVFLILVFSCTFIPIFYYDINIFEKELALTYLIFSSVLVYQLYQLISYIRSQKFKKIDCTKPETTHT